MKQKGKTVFLIIVVIVLLAIFFWPSEEHQSGNQGYYAEPVCNEEWD